MAEAKAAQAGEYVRQVEGEKRTREGLATSKFGDRSIMNTSFTMDLGETVVVGTSRLSGNSKALIALLTAVTSEVGAVGRRVRHRRSARYKSGAVASERRDRASIGGDTIRGCRRTPRRRGRFSSSSAEQHPGADTELHFSNAYELLVATILSAQCTDERVNQVTPALFQRYPDARALARADDRGARAADPVHRLLPRQVAIAARHGDRAGRADHGGEVPRTMEALVELPGVGRKTANVVLGHALGVPGLPVDRHVLRVANRIGIARSDDPVVVEQQLCAALPPADWTRASDTLILHGRRICKPRPLCDRCAVTEDCEYFRHVVSKERDGRQAAKQPRHRSAEEGPTQSRRSKHPDAQSTPSAKPRSTGRRAESGDT